MVHRKDIRAPYKELNMLIMHQITSPHSFICGLKSPSNRHDRAARGPTFLYISEQNSLRIWDGFQYKKAQRKRHMCNNCPHPYTTLLHKPFLGRKTAPRFDGSLIQHSHKCPRSFLMRKRSKCKVLHYKEFTSLVTQSIYHNYTAIHHLFH